MAAATTAGSGTRDAWARQHWWWRSSDDSSRCCGESENKPRQPHRIKIRLLLGGAVGDEGRAALLLVGGAAAP